MAFKEDEWEAGLNARSVSAKRPCSLQMSGA